MNYIFEDTEENQPETWTKIVYYSNDHSNSFRCTSKITDHMDVTFTYPEKWNELVLELERGCKFLVFHIDTIYKSIYANPEEFINVIMTIANFIPQSKDLKIGVIIKPDTSITVLRELQKAGAQGILLDNNHYSDSEIRLGINALINHIPYWPKHILNKLPNARLLVNDTNISKPVLQSIRLTDRQAQVFQLITQRGSSNKVIAKSLGISESTVKLHVSEIFKKYSVRNRTQLAVFSNSQL